MHVLIVDMGYDHKQVKMDFLNVLLLVNVHISFFDTNISM